MSKLAVAGAMASKFRNAGPDLRVRQPHPRPGGHPRSLRRRGSARRCAALNVGDGREAGVTIGPLINAAAAEKVAAHLDDAVWRTAARSSRRPKRPSLADLLASRAAHRRHAGDAAGERGDLRPARADLPLRGRGGGGRASPTTRRSGWPAISTPTISTAPGAWREALEFGMVGLNTGRSRWRWRRSAASSIRPRPRGRPRGHRGISGNQGFPLGRAQGVWGMNAATQLQDRRPRR